MEGSTDLAHQRIMLIYVAQIQNISSIANIDGEHVFYFPVFERIIQPPAIIFKWIINAIISTNRHYA